MTHVRRVLGVDRVSPIHRSGAACDHTAIGCGNAARGVRTGGAITHRNVVPHLDAKISIFAGAGELDRPSRPGHDAVAVVAVGNHARDHRIIAGRDAVEVSRRGAVTDPAIGPNPNPARWVNAGAVAGGGNILDRHVVSGAAGYP